MGKEMSLSGDLGLYYKWPKSDPNAVFELPLRPKCSFWVLSCNGIQPRTTGDCTCDVYLIFIAYLRMNSHSINHSSLLTKPSFWWIRCVQLRGGKSSSTRETLRANWSPDRAGLLTQIMAQPSSLSGKLKIKSQNCHISFGIKVLNPLL